MVDSGTKPPENRIHLFDPVGLITDNYGGVYKSSNTVFVRPKRPTKSYGNFEDVNTNEGLVNYDSFKSDANNNVSGLTSYNSFSMETNNLAITSFDKNHDNDKDGLELRIGIDKTKDLDDDSDVSTPRLWKTMNSSAFNSTIVNSSTLDLTSPMSPSSRTRAIANGRRELMDMVKDLPESFYELSLKDIVEQKAESEISHKGVIDVSVDKTVLQEISQAEETTKKGKKNNGKKVKKSDSKKMVRSRSVDNGRFLLRTSVFPYFSGGKKNKKGAGGSNSFKITQMGKAKTGSNGSTKAAGEKDWWRRKSCMSSDSDASNGLSSKSASASSGSSSSSSSIRSISNARNSNRFLPACCLFTGKRITAKK